MVTSSSTPYEVRCPLHGSIPFNERERRIVDHPFVQRLRHIRQLGFAELVYPGATHTRFNHALGVMHLAGRIFDRIAATAPPELHQNYSASALAECRQLVRLAGLLHDLGHGPYSHAFERLMPLRRHLPLPQAWYRELDGETQASHEDYSVALVFALSQDAPQLMPPHDAQNIAALISANVHPVDAMAHTGVRDAVGALYPLLKQIISGEIDADRMDYLRRDAHFAGVSYGFFDMDRLINALSCIHTEEGFVLALDHSALYTYEHFIMARFHMAMQVYLHKTLLPFEYFLHRAVRDGEIEFALDGSLDNFVDAREDTIAAQLYAARDKRWSSRIVNRIPPTRLIQLDAIASNGLRKRIVEALDAAGLPVFHIEEKRRVSNLGQPGNQSELPLYVTESILGRPRLRRLEESSDLLERYNRTFVIEALYCDREHLDRGREIVSQVMGINPG